MPVPADELRPVLPVPAEELVPVVPVPADELVPVAPVPAEELRPVTPAGDELLVVPVVLDALLSPDEVLVVPVDVRAPLAAFTPEHGATVGEVALVLLGEIVTPATLQLSGICCSMIST